ncbi:unnamed protein product [Caretta caretta]
MVKSDENQSPAPCVLPAGRRGSAQAEPREPSGAARSPRPEDALSRPQRRGRCSRVARWYYNGMAAEKMRL